MVVVTVPLSIPLYSGILPATVPLRVSVRFMIPHLPRIPVFANNIIYLTPVKIATIASPNALGPADMKPGAMYQGSERQKPSDRPKS